MTTPTLRSIAYALLVAILSMVALLVGLFTAGLILGFLSAYEPHKKIELVKYVERPAGAAAPSASAVNAAAPSAR